MFSKNVVHIKENLEKVKHIFWKLLTTTGTKGRFVANSKWLASLKDSKEAKENILVFFACHTVMIHLNTTTKGTDLKKQTLYLRHTVWSSSHCPGQRSQQRPIPVPMTCVCYYNSLLWMCRLNSLTWLDLVYLCMDIQHGRQFCSWMMWFRLYCMISWMRLMIYLYYYHY